MELATHRLQRYSKLYTKICISFQLLLLFYLQQKVLGILKFVLHLSLQTFEQPTDGGVWPFNDAPSNGGVPAEQPNAGTPAVWPFSDSDDSASASVWPFDN